MYIEYVERLRDRTIYLKVVEGKIVDPVTDGKWVNTMETEDHGAQLLMKAMENLDCLDVLNTRLLKQDVKAHIMISENEKELLVIDEEDKQIPFDIVMKALLS